MDNSSIQGHFTKFSGISVCVLFLMIVLQSCFSQPVKLPARASIVPLNQMFGINAYEWNFLQNPKDPSNVDTIYESKMALIKSFTAVRHYLDWKHLEPEKGHYTFNPSHEGGWNYDAMYRRCQQDHITVLACIKTCPPWLLNTYPENERDYENVPAPYGADKSQPSSYLQQAKMAFQFAARYGSNKKVNPALVSVDNKARWNGDKVNEKKIGLGLIQYIECDNERDKWWKGDKAHQTAEEYAANLSAFYDGDQGRLGKNAGVKNADPQMQVVMAGLANPDVHYVQGIVEWCKKHRGFKRNGQVDLCFDVINYHYYATNDETAKNEQDYKGISPESSRSGNIADQFVNYAQALPGKPPVWVTEAGYDLHPKSPQRATATSQQSAELVQANWLLRTSFLYMRHGISRLFFYQLFDDAPNSPGKYATSGLSEETKRRPAANFIWQTRKLLGNYHYQKTISQQPLVDVYQQGDKTVYVLINPTDGRTAKYTLNAGSSKTAAVYHLQPGADALQKTIINAKQGQFEIEVTSTPIFIVR